MTMTSQTPQKQPNICDAPEVAKLLPAYIVDLLKDSECERVETHVMNCTCCKEHYLTILQARQEAPLEPVPSVSSDQDAVKLPSAKAAAVSVGSSLARKRNSGGSNS